VTTDLLIDSGHPVFFPASGDFVPGLLLIEAVRQTSLLTATRALGFSALHTSVTRASVRFRGDAALDQPLTCTARVEPAGAGPDGRPSARIRSTIDHLDRIVAQAELTLTHAV
jgi:hypothetical protein